MIKAVAIDSRNHTAVVAGQSFRILYLLVCAHTIIDYLHTSIRKDQRHVVKACLGSVVFVTVIYKV